MLLNPPTLKNSKLVKHLENAKSNKNSEPDES